MTEHQKREVMKTDSAFAYLYGYIVQISIVHQLSQFRRAAKSGEQVLPEKEEELHEMKSDTQKYLDMIMKHNVDLDNMKKPIREIEYDIALEDNRVQKITNAIVINMDNQIDMYNQLKVYVGDKKARRILELATRFSNKPSAELEKKITPLLADVGQVMIYDEWGFYRLEQEQKKPTPKKKKNVLDGAFEQIFNRRNNHEDYLQQAIEIEILLREAEAADLRDENEKDEVGRG